MCIVIFHSNSITIEASHMLKPTEKEKWVFTQTTAVPVEFIEDYCKHQGEVDFLAISGLLWVIRRCYSFLFSTLLSLLLSQSFCENRRLSLPQAPRTSFSHPRISQSSSCCCSQLNSPNSSPSPASLFRPCIPSPFVYARTWLRLFPLSFLLHQV